MSSMLWIPLVSGHYFVKERYCNCNIRAGTLEQEEKETFKNVMLRQVHLFKVPADLSVAQSHIRIDSVSHLHDFFFNSLSDLHPDQSSKHIWPILL